MADNSSRTSRQPQVKLRSSCDECGHSKVKCDRAKPECGRCRSMGLQCVYGVSQKCAKSLSSRQMSKVDTASPATADATKRTHSSDSVNSMQLDPLTFPAMNTAGAMDTSTNSAFPAMDTSTTNAFPAMEGTADLNSLLNPFMLPQTNEWDFTNYLTSNPFTPPNSSSNSVKYANTAAFQPAYQHPSPTMSLTGSPTSDDHDCLREAYTVLGSMNLNQTTPTASNPASSHSYGVPLDHVLRLNKQACDGIRRFLACSCAQHPQLALLCASIFARVLIWYQQAAIDTQPPSQQASKPDPASGFPLQSPAWPNAGTSVPKTSCAKDSRQFKSSGVEIAPTQVAVGSFQIDDHMVQTTLRIQLVLAELKNIECIIDLFASQSNSHHFSSDASPYSGVDSLYGSLASWLRGEHARIVGTLKCKLNKLSDHRSASGR